MVLKGNNAPPQIANRFPKRSPGTRFARRRYQRRNMVPTFSSKLQLVTGSEPAYVNCSSRLECNPKGLGSTSIRLRPHRQLSREQINASPPEPNARELARKHSQLVKPRAMF